MPVVEGIGHGCCEIRGAAALNSATEDAQAVWLDPAFCELFEDLVQFAGLDGSGRGKAEHHAFASEVERRRDAAIHASSAARSYRTDLPSLMNSGPPPLIRSFSSR
ncbi:hypothetical protein CHKEEEPN_4381 [Methylorubrum podarium]|nr:hypothetical protein CHKEEEPN_4381 [Methylorubrum podarium]